MGVDLSQPELQRIISLLNEEDDADLLKKIKFYLQTSIEVPTEAGDVSGLANQVTQKYRDGF